MATKEYQREYVKKRRKDPEYVAKERAYHKAYYEQNKDDPEYKRKRIEYHAKWQKENRDKWNAYHNEYRRKKRAQDRAAEAGSQNKT